jgi:O-antigen/teichoic acid export membrane protein
VFVLAGNVAGVALILKAAFSRTWDPHTVTWIGTRDERVYLPRLQAAADYIAPLVAISTLLAIAWGDTIFELIFPTAYGGAGRILPVLVLGGTLATLSLVANLAELISGRAKYRLSIYSIGLAVNIAVCLVLVPRYGAYAAAMGALAGEIAILLLWIGLGSWLLGNLRLDWKLPLSCVGASVALLAYRPGNLIPGNALIEQLLITALCVVAMWLLALRALKTFRSLADANA